MSYKFKYKETFNADDEEPNCLTCNHKCDSYEAFCSKCGPEYWWHYYVRTEITEIEISDEEYEKRLKRLRACK